MADKRVNSSYVLYLNAEMLRCIVGGPKQWIFTLMTKKITTNFIYQKPKTKPTTHTDKTKPNQTTEQRNNRSPLVLSFLFLVPCPVGFHEKVELPVRECWGPRTPRPTTCPTVAFTLTQALLTTRPLEPSLPPEQPVLWWLRVPTHSYRRMEPWKSRDILS